MDTLAELASMQHHQQATRANAGGLRSTEIYDNQGSATSAMLSNIPAMHGSLPARGSLDRSAAESLSHNNASRSFVTDALSEAESEAVTQLVTYLSTNQFAYESHVQLVNLLHKGFRTHVEDGSSPPHTYSLLSDLRSARESMDARFAVGESLWVDWIEDEKVLATTFDECIAVMELCLKAVQEESVSTKLWGLYANWTLSLYVAATGDSAAQEVVQSFYDIQSWSDEDKLVAAEVCTWQQLLDVWSRGAGATRWRVDESHTLWDPYTELLLLNLTRSPSSEGTTAMKTHLINRLYTPHSTWDTTFQKFSNFISHHENHSYEAIMANVNRQCSQIKAMYEAREMLELSVKRAIEGVSDSPEQNVFHEYIDWEVAQSRRKHAFVFDLAVSLYQRALLIHPANTDLWEEYVMFLTDEIVSHSRQDIELLPVLERSTRHCPWSGSLWSQYLLAAERQRMPYPDVEQIKHKATSTSLLDAGDLDEVLQVYVAWCSILRRRAFQEESTDEELDVAEFGIRSAIEDMQRLGEAKYGREYQGDPNYRLERIYIKYLTQSRNWHAVRQSWKNLIPSRGDSYEFWLRYYLWEMGSWGKISYSENAANAPSSPRPSEATKVLRTALKRPKLDWPERIIQILQHHCEDHEDAAELQSAGVQIWKAKKAIRKRREREAIEAYEAAQAQALQQAHFLKPETSADSAISFTTSKRKRQDERDQGDEEIPKRTRIDDDGGRSAAAEEILPDMSTELKRDRENSTIIVKNLSKDTTEKRVRHFFGDCGTINNLILAPNEHSDTTVATIEFQSRDDVLTAQTKDRKTLDGQEIEIQAGSGAIIWVNNFPPTADEAWIREKFEKYGEILDIRLPSLKFNTRRRFCYIQFKTADQAHSATVLNGQKLDLKHKLEVKISDPSKRQDRVGAFHEGREIHIRNLDWAVTDTQLESEFSKYGVIEKVRILRDVSGKSRGTGFIAFSTQDDANSALQMNGKKLGQRELTVMLASKTAAKRQATTIIQPDSRSSTPHAGDVKMADGDDSNIASPASSANNEVKPTPAEIQARTVALLNVPDTVNDARVRALAEEYGPLVKISLRPDHQGAILEFGNIADAGKAALGIDGYEITPGRSLSVGTVKEMLNQRAEKRRDKLGSHADRKKENMLPINMAIRRPAQEGGRRGGLGVKRGGTASINAAKPPSTNKDSPDTTMDHVSDAKEGEGKKTNEDFKAMFSGPKKNA
ncbi:MAG: hypothetical protein Q9219_005316 [cf. Caloplaca sp. 3 TL-2023]